MSIQRAAPANELLARLIFLILPTAGIGYFLLVQVNEYYAILQNRAVQQALYFGAGMGIAALLYSFRFRFLPTFLLLLLGLYTAYKGLDRYESGEFDAFFIARHFQVFAILFSTGWLVGWGFVRVRYWAACIAAALLTACIALIAKANADTVAGLLGSFAPALLYSIYVVFTAEQIYNFTDKTGKFWWFLSRRLAFFGVLAAMILGGVVYMMRKELKATVANYGGGGKGGDNNMMKETKDHKFDLKDYSTLGSSLSRSNQLLFCAHINNFFPGTDIPNPLYLTAFYFTKFDTATETFERDQTIPSNDLFQPDPSKIPLFSTRYDSSVIGNSMGEKLRATVEIEVYAKQLSPTTYLAPNVGYFVQPIAIEKDFRGEFTSAFRAKSYTSLLNSAYFVYNAQDPQIQAFQEKRFEVLRKVVDYDSIDDAFMKYYTYMPGSEKFRFIDKLAHDITDTAHTPLDKVLAIRNYFLSKDEHGERLYKYTDNPGIPDLPNASKLLYFLQENHKGYCAYYAGATLFMLRSLGIPSRIAVGFLTEDRSDKNKGWYWYYANQAHAWVQVYFPGYGWLDFDTTVGNDNENRTTPQPDGTPPMQPPRAWLAADGVVEDVDTLKKRVLLAVKQLVFHDQEYKLAKQETLTLDVAMAIFYRDSAEIPLRAVRKGDQGTAVSYDDALKQMSTVAGETGTALAKRLPVPTPIDEVYLKRGDTAPPKEKEQQVAAEKHLTVRDVLLGSLVAILSFIVLLLSIPQWVYRYYVIRHNRAKAAGVQSYWAFRAATYYLHMVGVPRGTLTPMQYARERIDPAFGTSFTVFMNVYLKHKYAKQPLNAVDEDIANNFLADFIPQVRKQVGFWKRYFGFRNTFRCVGFFMLPDEEEV